MKLISTNKIFDSLSRAIPDFQLIVDAAGIILQAQAGCDGVLFFGVENLVGKKIDNVMSGEVSDQYHYFIQEALAKKAVVTCEHKFEVKQARLDYEARFVACDDKTVLILVRDVTSIKKADAQIVHMMVGLEESYDNMISILNQLSIGTAITDKNGQLTFMSAQAKTLLGLGDEVMQQSWQQVLPFLSQEIEQIRRMSELVPRQRLKIPVKVSGGDERETWLDIEVRDHPQDSHKKIFLFHDVSEVHALKQLLDEKGRFQGMIGQSQVMQEVFQQIRELAGLDVTVLVQGESGTGKELVARALHTLSERHEEPFIAVNCAGLTSGSLLASQLFGHKKGAFTGAVGDQQGLVEAANGGTLFLDEIGDIPPDVQTSLLRFLQEREIVRLGESKPVRINVRIIAASQYDLKTHVDSGKFRLDLYYRIHVASVVIPPLRERREDIPLLATFFLAKSKKNTGKDVSKFSSDAMQSLIQHSYPGNVRELAALVEAAVIRARVAVIGRDDLPSGFLVGLASQPAAVDEKQRIDAALKQTRGNRSEAAKVLGMSRATFYRRLGELSVSQIDTK